jgi:hypothetical protein
MRKLGRLLLQVGGFLGVLVILVAGVHNLTRQRSQRRFRLEIFPLLLSDSLSGRCLLRCESFRGQRAGLSRLYRGRCSQQTVAPRWILRGFGGPPQHQRRPGTRPRIRNTYQAIESNQQVFDRLIRQTGQKSGNRLECRCRIHRRSLAQNGAVTDAANDTMGTPSFRFSADKAGPILLEYT